MAGGDGECQEGRYRLVKLIPEWYRSRMAMTLRIDDELEQALDTLSKQEGLSRQEIVRRAVLAQYERSAHRSRVAESARLMDEEWGDVLDRLGSV